MSRRPATVRLLLGALVALGPFSALRAQTDPARIVAVADPHADLRRLTAALHAAGVVDGGGAWAGGDADVVLVGDLVDRGPASQAVLELAMRLEQESSGRLHALLGNHEALAVMRDPRYVATAEYAAFATPRSEELRETRYAEWARFIQQRAERLGFAPPASGGANREAWLRDRPPGFFERWEAFGPGGPQGRWIRGLDAAVLIGETLFVHGGLSETRRFDSVAGLNQIVRAELAAFDARWASLAEAGILWPHATWREALELVAEELDLWQAIDSLPADQVDPAALEARPTADVLRQMEELLASERWAIAAPDGPLWYRGLAQDPESQLGWLAGVLEPLGASRIAVGHTPTSDHRIKSRLGGRVLLLDSGLSEAVGGRPSALVIEGGQARAVYPGAPPETLASAGVHDALLGLSLERVEAFLREAPIAAVRKIGRGVTKPSKATLDDGVLQHDAAIQTVHTCTEFVIPGVMAADECDSWRHNVAAYELSKLLGLDGVVPSVARPFDGRAAAFTWWIDDAVTFDEMKARGTSPPDGTTWNQQQWRVGVFDELIFNTDRNQGNLLVDPAWRIWMIDHSRAFRPDPRARNPAMLGKMRLDPTLLAGLRELDGADLETCCSDLLEADQRSALLARRDTILVRLAGPEAAR